jgi:hypothetical protein
VKSSPPPRVIDLRRRQLLVLTFAVRAIAALFGLATEDVGGWQRIVLTAAAAGDVYATGLVNWPPVWPAILVTFMPVADWFGIPFAIAVKVAPIFADVAIAAFLYDWFLVKEPMGNRKRAFRKGLLWALNPISIYVTAFHGQFDALPAFAAAAALILFEVGFERRAAAMLAIGALVKTWPVILIPALLHRLTSWKARIRFCFYAATPLVLVMGGLWIADGGVIVKNVFRYTSSPGWWGLTAIPIVTGVAASVEFLTTARLAFLLAVVAASLVAAFAPNATAGQRSLLLLLTFYVFTPGFGLQYLVWIIPIGLAAQTRATVMYSAIGSCEIALEALFRPYRGFLLETIRQVPPNGFARVYGSSFDRFYTDLLRLPLWIFVCVWLTWLTCQLIGLEKARYSS